MSPYKHVFVVLNYTENEVTLGLNKTCTTKKTNKKLGNVSLAKPYPEYEYGKISILLIKKKILF